MVAVHGILTWLSSGFSQALFFLLVMQYSIGASNVGIGHDGLSFISLKSSTLGRRFFFIRWACRASEV